MNMLTYKAAAASAIAHLASANQATVFDCSFDGDNLMFITGTPDESGTPAITERSDATTALPESWSAS